MEIMLSKVCNILSEIKAVFLRSFLAESTFSLVRSFHQKCQDDLKIRYELAVFVEKWLINQLVGGLSKSNNNFAWLFKRKSMQEERESEDDLLESAEFVYTMSEVFPIFGI